MPKEEKFTLKEEKFVAAYIKHGIGVEAYIEAGYALLDREKMAVKASTLLKRPKIKNAIAKAKVERSERTSITADLVLKRLWMIATADPSELVKVQVNNCRHCWGINFQYQFTEGEWEKKVATAEELKLEPPDEQGGVGYTPTRPPHPDCPVCLGAGLQNVSITDTKELSPQARLLYAGAEATRGGIKVKMHDQMQALVKVADHLGMFESSTIEALRQAQLAKIEAETRELGKNITPVKVEIQVVDGKNPDRIKGEKLKPKSPKNEDDDLDDEDD